MFRPHDTLKELYLNSQSQSSQIFYKICDDLFDQNLIEEKLNATPVDYSEYHQYKISKGLLSLNLQPCHVDKFLPFSLNLDRLHALADNKGCYIGQEVVRRLWVAGNFPKRTHIVEYKQPVTDFKQASYLVQEYGELIDFSVNKGLIILKKNYVGYQTDGFVIKAPDYLVDST